MTLLVAPDPLWPEQAQAEKARWVEACGPDLRYVHHVGSTAVAGMPAKPIIDLMPVFVSDNAAESARPAIERMGYEWLGEHGLSGRRYCRLDDEETGRRIAHAHCYVVGHPDVLRHLAFRDSLRQNATLRAGYASIKAACAARHPDGGAGYGACKAEWIDKAEALALARRKERFQ